MLQAMPAGEYVRFFKSAHMLSCQKRITDIEAASFHTYKDGDRDKVMRSLKKGATEFLFMPVKDFAEVAKSFAKAMTNGG